jgi:hypothetical protein
MLIIEGAMELGPSGEFGVKLRPTEEVGRDFGLGKESVPQVYWKFWVETAQTCNEVILEGPNAAFHSIAAVDTGWH